jgi:aspartate/methionine/tyrosine aminotransferase
VNLNPHLLGTAAPPIPEAKAWTARYRGAAGPLIDLSQAVPGYPPPDELLRRIAEAASTPEASAYGDILGDRDLRERYATHVSRLYGGVVAPSEVAITTGCNQAFVVAIMALAKAGDAVMLPTPWYFNHKMTLDLLGIRTVELPCRAEAGFAPDAADAEPLIDGRVRAVVLVSPNNPTGAIYSPATIGAFAGLCARHGLALIVDETYRDFLSAAALRPHDLFADPAWRNTVVELYSFSKAYCIPGQRMGALIAGARFVDEIAKILDCIQICPNRPPQRALVWAIEALASWRNDNREIILDRAAAFRSALDRLDGWSIESIGAYFAYLRHPFPGRLADDVGEWLAVERGVLCLPGSYFGSDQQDFLRVAFANVDAATIASLPPRLAGAMPESRAEAAGMRRA